MSNNRTFCLDSQKGECRFDVYKPAVCEDNYYVDVVVQWERNITHEEEVYNFGPMLEVVSTLPAYDPGLQ